MQMQTLQPENRKKRRLAYWLIMGGGGAARTLIEPNFISPSVTFSGAQAVGVEATGLTGAGWQTFGSNVPRFVAPNGGLLIGGQRTNLLTTARAPATETVTVTAAAHTLSFIGTGSIALSGAATGTLAGTGASNRVTLTFTPSAGSLTLTVSGSVTLPQLELGSFASTPILPPVGSPGASTRGGDIVTAPLSSLGVSSNGACTVLWRGAFDVTNIGTAQTIVAVQQDGTDTSRYNLQLSASGVPQVLRVTAGVNAIANFTGSPHTPGAVLRAGMCIDGAGRVAGVFEGYNSGAALAVTGGPTNSLTTLHCGSSTTGARPMWGTVERLQVLPRVVSDAELAALVATF